MPQADTSPIAFPPVHTANASGLLALGGRLDADILLAAYAQGAFPWHDDPVAWYAPDPRAVFERGAVHLPRNLGKLIRRAKFAFSYDQAFDAVLAHCAHAHRSEGVWITPRFAAAYGELHRRGHAHSVEVWQGQALVGGLYGVQLGGLFAGESMFSLEDNASKAAFWALLQQIDVQGIELIDAQVENAHTLRLGAQSIAREDYMRRLGRALKQRTPGSGAAWASGWPP